MSAALALLAVVLISTANALPAINSLNATAYLGRWYQMYDNELADIIYAHDPFCATADYGLNGPRNVSVYNTQRSHSADGEFGSILGYAMQSEIHEAELSVSFPGVPATSEYWIVNIGPQTYTGDALCSPCYSWAVVSDGSGFSLFVLTRDVDDYVNSYNSTVYPWLLEHGFTNQLNAPRYCYQGPECDYPPSPSPSQDL